MLDDPVSLRALAERAREASEADPQLDADVWFALLPEDKKCVLRGIQHIAAGYSGYRRTFEPLIAGSPHIPGLSASLNDVEREAVPPGWTLDWPRFATEPPYRCNVFPPEGAEDLGRAEGIGQTRALAALSAALEARAIIAEAEA